MKSSTRQDLASTTIKCINHAKRKNVVVQLKQISELCELHALLQPLPEDFKTNSSSIKPRPGPVTKHSCTTSQAAPPSIQEKRRRRGSRIFIHSDSNRELPSLMIHILQFMSEASLHGLYKGLG